VVLREGAMATEFGMPFNTTGYVGYYIGCVIASDTLLIRGVGFGGEAI